MTHSFVLNQQHHQQQQHELLFGFVAMSFGFDFIVLALFFLGKLSTGLSLSESLIIFFIVINDQKEKAGGDEVNSSASLYSLGGTGPLSPQ
jgi:hypothetical protein